MSATEFNHVPELLRSLDKLKKKKITVGIHGDVGSDIFDRAVANEFGTSKIPERSFIRASYDKEKKNIEKDAKKLIEKVISREMTPNEALETLGDVAVGYVKEFAVDLRDPPNAPMTIALKGSSNPLVDSGQMIDIGIDYKIEG